MADRPRKFITHLYVVKDSNLKPEEVCGMRIGKGNRIARRKSALLPVFSSRLLEHQIMYPEKCEFYCNKTFAFSLLYVIRGKEQKLKVFRLLA
jgi:hypothetical protein